MSGYPIFARLYGRFAAVTEKAGTGAHRHELLAGLTGRVIEVGAGSGLCFAHYPPTVSEVIAVEPEPYLRGLAEQAAADAPIPVRVVAGDADHLPGGDGSFDAAVVSLVLCSVPDPDGALRELRRVIRPQGQLRFYEHVLSDQASLARLQRRVDWCWPFFFGGCHANRPTEATIAAGGFRIEQCRRFDFRPRATAAPVAPHILGVATRTELA